jgi:hypothetical protein
VRRGDVFILTSIEGAGRAQSRAMTRVAAA